MNHRHEKRVIEAFLEVPHSPKKEPAMTHQEECTVLDDLTDLLIECGLSAPFPLPDRGPPSRDSRPSLRRFVAQVGARSACPRLDKSHGEASRFHGEPRALFLASSPWIGSIWPRSPSGFAAA